MDLDLYLYLLVYMNTVCIYLPTESITFFFVGRGKKPSFLQNSGHNPNTKRYGVKHFR